MNPLKSVFGIGEVLWDVFPDGPRFGGAPANFCCGAAQLGRGRISSCLVSSVGEDELGRAARNALLAHGVGTDGLDTSTCATGQVLVKLSPDGHASYEFATDSAWDNLTWSTRLEELARRADAVCFGTLGQRSAPSRETIRRFLRAAPPTCLRVLDANLRAPFWSREVVSKSLELSNVLKLNDSELPILAELLGWKGSDRELLTRFLETYPLKLVALTCGSDGSTLLDASGEWSRLPARSIQVRDTVGAGDAFTAALVVGLLDGMTLGSVHAWASRVAAFVCTQAGATPRLPDSLCRPEGPFL